MSNRDPVTILTLSQSDDAATNGILFPILIHKITMTPKLDASTNASAILYNAATATGTPFCQISTALRFAVTPDQLVQIDYDPPVPITAAGISSTIAGTAGLACKIHYTRV